MSGCIPTRSREARCGGQNCSLCTVRLAARYRERNYVMVTRTVLGQIFVQKCYLILGRVNPLSIVRPYRAGKIRIHLSQSAEAENGQLGHLPSGVEEFDGLSRSSGRCAPRRCPVEDVFCLFCGVVDGACRSSGRSVPAVGGARRIGRVRRLIATVDPGVRSAEMVPGHTGFLRVPSSGRRVLGPNRDVDGSERLRLFVSSLFGSEF